MNYYRKHKIYYQIDRKKYIKIYNIGKILISLLFMGKNKKYTCDMKDLHLVNKIHLKNFSDATESVGC